MKNVNEYRKKFADLRDSILVEIGSIIRRRPNWYMKIQDVQNKLVYEEISMGFAIMILSVTVKDFGDQGEKEVVWIGERTEDDYVRIETLDTDLMINVLEAMYEALDDHEE
jgi:hypothetical protein